LGNNALLTIARKPTVISGERSESKTCPERNPKGTCFFFSPRLPQTQLAALRKGTILIVSKVAKENRGLQHLPITYTEGP
jgi:hypothetical protein